MADLHIHSQYSRVTSKGCDLENLALWAVSAPRRRGRRRRHLRLHAPGVAARVQGRAAPRRSPVCSACATICRGTSTPVCVTLKVNQQWARVRVLERRAETRLGSTQIDPNLRAAVALNSRRGSSARSDHCRLRCRSASAASSRCCISSQLRPLRTSSQQKRTPWLSFGFSERMRSKTCSASASFPSRQRQSP